jgi:hypothetical protein
VGRVRALHRAMNIAELTGEIGDGVLQSTRHASGATREAGPLAEHCDHEPEALGSAQRAQARKFAGQGVPARSFV